MAEPVDRSLVVALDRAHVWPPYTPHERHEREDPIVVVKAQGSWLEDADGRRYFDAFSSWWAVTLGHCHPRLVARLRAQSESLCHVSTGGATHPELALLARDLINVAPPGLARVHFSDDGSTAVEAAIKIAFQYWQQNGYPSRRRFVALGGAYHGETVGAMSLASVEEFTHVFGPLLFKVYRPPHPHEEGGWERVLEHLERFMRSHKDEIAGLIVEPLIQGASGMRMHSPKVLKALHEICSEIDTFFIADEVFTGYGRTGTMWACGQAGITPDILCVAKGFTAGVLPMAATLVTARIYEGFSGGMERALLHGHTFCGHALGAVVAREVLAIYREEGVLEGIPERAVRIARWAERMALLPRVRGHRALGMVGAIDLGELGYGGSGIGWEVARAARKRGIFLRPLGDTVYVAPRLNVPLDELDWLLEALEDAVREVLDS
ncbi:MAG: adenosylmethionine--8-amino-7-oxononanoate transaminase [Sandaracinaceae bacterium]|nr:adenosylmethionine--8-amino-7-oxononanoate transaminase [Sandaracinaceae bacterium]MDW8245736.1 adenosylmethionine--8-amino-7-oxononanoate transaminase [Sandaracinaceae bacterium]